MRKIVLLGLIAAVLLLAFFLVADYLSTPIVVFAKQWTGLGSPFDVAIGDYDNDGLNDLAFTEYETGKVTVYKSDGTTVIKQWTGLFTPCGVAIGDFDNDGLNDLAFTQMFGDNVTVYKSCLLYTSDAADE